MSGAPHQELRQDPRERQGPREKVAAHHREGRGIRRIPYPVGIRTAEVVRKEYLNPRMLRLTIGGPSLDGFHSYQADDHVKIVFPDPQGTLRLPTANEQLTLDWPRPLPITRKYTVRRFDAASRELDLDFVIHPGGIASEWAVSAEPGDPVSIAGPPGAKAFPQSYDHYVLAVDATALPAAARWLEEAPQDVSAQLVIETGTIAEHGYPLPRRDGVRITRLVRVGERSRLAPAVRSLFLPTGRGFLFAAGEAEDIKPLRAFAKDRMDALFTGYWKRGVAGLED